MPTLQGWSGKQFVSKPSPYLFVEKFAVRKWHARSNMPACVDMMSKGICGICTPDRLRRIFATSQVRLIDSGLTCYCGLTLGIYERLYIYLRRRTCQVCNTEGFSIVVVLCLLVLNLNSRFVLTNPLFIQCLRFLLDEEAEK